METVSEKERKHYAPVLPERILGVYDKGVDGPLVFCIGSIHGNEPSGVFALRRVLESLERSQPHFKGRFVAVIGNRHAFVERKRYIDQDLNRMWGTAHLHDVLETVYDEDLNVEERELIELLFTIAHYSNDNHSPKIFLDMHTTSAKGGLFSIVTDDPYNREIAQALHAPIIFNLANALSTTTLRFLEFKGYKGLAFESGQHDDPAAIDNHEAAVWMLLEKTGCIKREEVPDFDQYSKRLKKASDGLAEYVKVVYRHEINGEEGFCMNPGFQNFQQVSRDQALAHDTRGEIHSPDDGMVLMPLYQPQGEEGFFLVKQIDEPLI